MVQRNGIEDLVATFAKEVKRADAEKKEIGFLCIRIWKVLQTSFLKIESRTTLWMREWRMKDSEMVRCQVLKHFQEQERAKQKEIKQMSGEE